MLHVFLGLCLAMFLGSMIAGYLPLALKCSEQSFRLVTTLGVGLLIGVAFIVIIPEGFHAVFTCEPAPRGSLEPLTPGSAALPVNSAAPGVAADSSYAHEHEGEHSHEGHGHSHSHSHSDAGRATPCYRSSNADKYVGHALILGFVFMLLVDQLNSAGGGGHGHSHGIPPPASAHGAHSHEMYGGAPETAALSFKKPPEEKDRTAKELESQRRSSVVVIGVIVHCAVDGIALGTISSSQNETLEMIVFLAIILHKAPAAFGITSYLTRQGIDYKTITKQLFVFSCAAPLAALFTYFLLSQGIFSRPADPGTLGLCLLFSGGTFVYTVATHILPEISTPAAPADACADGSSGASASGLPAWKQNVALVAGIVLPLFISIEHSH